MGDIYKKNLNDPGKNFEIEVPAGIQAPDNFFLIMTFSLGAFTCVGVDTGCQHFIHLSGMVGYILYMINITAATSIPHSPLIKIYHVRAYLSPFIDCEHWISICKERSNHISSQLGILQAPAYRQPC